MTLKMLEIRKGLWLKQLKLLDEFTNPNCIEVTFTLWIIQQYVFCKVGLCGSTYWM